jgi:hypothetical protein
LLFDIFEPIDIYKKQLQAREQTHAGNAAHYHVCVKAVEAMAADVKIALRCCCSSIRSKPEKFHLSTSES